MSLDVYLYDDNTLGKNADRSGIFIREEGQTKEISHAEWDEKFPGRKPIIAQIDEDSDGLCFTANITHNLGEMAEKAGIYQALWRPKENGYAKAKNLIHPLEKGLDRLRTYPEFFRQFNPSNGWGTYEILVNFTEAYLSACRKHPHAEVSVWR